MGLLVDGQWHDQWYDTSSSGGRFVREDSQFRGWLGEAGAAATATDGYLAEAGRYHLYVSLACPWAHRTLVMRALKGLQDFIGVSVVSPVMLEQGWTFKRAEGSSGDELGDRDFLHQLYTQAQPDYTGRVTVPVLWDTRTNSIVNNESAEILRMFNSAFNELTGNRDDYYPQDLRADIDTWNERIYPAVNNGVYRAGFATTQEAYEEAYGVLFAELEHIDRHLGQSRYLTGEQITEADIRLFTTLIRFDAVYHGHFKCNYQRLEDYENLPGYVRDIYQLPGIAQTVDFHHMKHHYNHSHRTINPSGIVPLGPEIDYSTAHGRG